MRGGIVFKVSSSLINLCLLAHFFSDSILKFSTTLYLLPEGYCLSQGVGIHTLRHSCIGKTVSKFLGICTLSLGRIKEDPVSKSF